VWERQNQTVLSHFNFNFALALHVPQCGLEAMAYVTQDLQILEIVIILVVVSMMHY